MTTHTTDTDGPVEVLDLAPQPAAVVHGRLTVSEIPAFLGRAFGEVIETLAHQGLGPAGPPFGRYVPVDGAFDVEAGFPATGTVTPEGRVVPADLPGGPTARLLHTGDYGGVGRAYEQLTTWVAEHGRTVTAPPWESYLDGPEVEAPRTVVSLPCSAG